MRFGAETSSCDVTRRRRGRWQLVAAVWMALSLSASALAGPPAQATPDRFRTFLFGADYYPEQWDESMWERDAQRMQDAGVNVVRVAEFAWYLMEPKEGEFDFALFDRAIATLGRHGIKTIIGTPTATPPKWLTAKYPEVLHVESTGRPSDDQSRRHVCYTSPVYLAKSREIVEAMTSHFKENANVVGWQIDNELNCEKRDCYSESCRKAFREWLKAKYGTLRGLNTRWGTYVWSGWYDDWDEIDLPFPTPSFHNPGLMLDYKRFVSDSAIAFLDAQLSIIRKARPNDFVTTNGVFKNIDYYKMSKGLDIHAYDNYPTFMDDPQYPTGAALTMCRSFNGRMMIMEELMGPAGQTYLLRTPSPEQVRLWTMQTVAHGADGVLHFRWRTARKGAEEYWFGVLDQDDVPRGRYENFKQEGRELGKIGPEIVGSRNVADVAVLKDFDDEWVYDHQYFTNEVSVGSAYTAIFRAASEAKLGVDFVGQDADFSRYKILFVPYKIMMDPALAARLKAFVEAGGVLVASAHTAVKDRDNAVTDETLPWGMTDLFGVEVDTFTCYQPPSAGKNVARFADGSTVPVNVFADVLKLKSAKALATWDGDFFKGSPALTENAVGRGKAVYYASFVNVEAARAILGRYAKEKGVAPFLTGAPKDLEVTRRAKGSATFTFLLNHGATPVTVPVGAGYTDMLEGKPAPDTLTIRPYGYVVLRR